MLEPDDSTYQSESHQRILRTLVHKVKSIQLTELIEEDNPPSNGTSSRVISTANLFRLAINIYLERVANRATESKETISQLAREALSLLQEPEHSMQRFPLFVVALEAQGEEERADVLRVFSRVAEKAPDGLTSLRAMVVMAWVRLDLCGGWEGIDALRLYSQVISSNVVPPAFV